MHKDLVKVLLPNGVVLGVTTLADLEAVLKIALLVASLVYTAHKLFRELKRK
jgi:hypothetical protein